MDIFIVDGIRTAIGSFGGSLSNYRADDLAAEVLKNLVSRNKNLPPEKISEVILGCANQAGEDNRNIARMAVLLAGLPYTIPAETVNRLCASGMSAIINAARAIYHGDGNVYIAGGVENMTRAPYVLSKSSKAFGNDAKLFDTSLGWRFINEKMNALYGTEAMGQTAENLATQYKIGRLEQDEFSVQSQQKAAAAKNRLSKEILPLQIEDKKEFKTFDTDEFIKPNTNIETLSKLKPAFVKDNGTVTAGNSSGLNDGAAAVLLANNNSVKEFNFKPIAKIVSMATVGVEPRIMGIGPVGATKLALSKANLNLNDIGVIELNEAFAAQSIACLKELGIKSDDKRVNINGGAIALGHPLGMSGTRIVYTTALEMQQQNKKYGLATMCVGVGQGYAVILELC